MSLKASSPRLPGRPKRQLWLLLLAAAGAAISSAYYLHALDRKAIAESNRASALALADELRHTSDDLTRMVRTYVITGNPLYKQHFQEILDIRDGHRPRPAGMGEVYWDLVTEDDHRPRPDGPPAALLDLMRQAGIVEAEFELLRQSKVASDALTRTELAAMALVEANPSPETRMAASRMLYDKTYHKAKAEIMQGIADFTDRIERRTHAELTEARSTDRHALALLIATAVAAAFLVGRLLFSWYQGQRLLEAAQRQQALMSRLAETERRLRIVTTGVKDYAIIALDLRGDIASWNEGAQHIKGCEEEEIIGRPMSTFYTPEDQAEGKPAALLQQAHTEERVEDEGWRVRKDGTRFYANVILTPIRNEVGELIGFSKITRDITARKAAEQALAEKREQLSLFIEHAPAALAMFDREMCYLAVSHRWLTDFRLGERDLTGLSHYEVFPEIGEAWKEMYRRVLAGEAITSEEDHFPRRDGTEHWLRWQAHPWRDANGLIGGILIFSEDITERKRLDAALDLERRRLRNIIEGTTEGFWLISAELRTLDINAALCRMLGYRREEMLGRTPLEFADKANQSIFHEQMEKITDTDHRTYPIELRTRAGDNLPTLFNSSTLRDSAGAIDVAFAFVTDMRRYKEYESQLIQAKRAAEAANHAKSAFLANMSHELRTPLNSILGFAQVMERDTALPENQRNRIASIRRGGEYLLALINDILDLAKIEAGRLDVMGRDWLTEPFFSQLREMLNPRAAARNLQMEVRVTEAVPRALHCDDIRLRQILMNLLGNALKFTDQGGVTLSAHYQNGRLFLDVADSGVGMNEEELSLIFNPFTQVGAEERRIQGTGLGLTISQRLVKIMGGALGVESEVGNGSRFYFDIPATPVITEANSASKAPSTGEVVGYRRLAGTGKFQLLSVDDCPENREALRELLKPLGFDVTEAASGEECLERVSSATPDAVLLDLRMPKMDGKECTRRLRALPGTDQLVIVAVSASAFRNDIDEAITAGCDAHIAKPIILSELLSILGRYLPIEWQHRPPEPADPITAARAMSEKERSQLRNALKRGAVLELQQLATTLAKSDNPPQGANEIADAAHRFDLKRVRILLDTLES